MPPIISSSDEFTNVAGATPVRYLPEPMRSWSGLSSEYPRSGTVAKVFEEIANKYASNIALVQGNVELTYRELNRRANRLAQRLRGAGVTLESLVPCFLERSIE